MTLEWFPELLEVKGFGWGQKWVVTQRWVIGDDTAEKRVNNFVGQLSDQNAHQEEIGEVNPYQFS